MAFLPPPPLGIATPRRATVGATNPYRHGPALLPHHRRARLPPTSGLKENVAQLPSTAHIARLDVTITAALSATPLSTRATIDNVDGSRASVAIYAAIAKDDIIAVPQAEEGLRLYAEAVGDGGKHPNIEILQQVAAGETIVEIETVLA